MSIILKSNQLTVIVSTKGAELQSIQKTDTGAEYLWQGDPTYWNRKAPVLFPIVGRLKDNQYTYKGQSYTMNQHGFARDAVFTVLEETENRVTLQFKANEETKKAYPFDFSLCITYTVMEDKVSVEYAVQNTNESEVLYFSIGGHPGFNVPLTEDTAFEDYYLSFLPRKSRKQIPLSGPFADPAQTTLAQTNTTLRLSRELFENDALVFEVKEKNTFSILSDKTERSVSVMFENYPYVGIWSVPGKEAPFVCIEPWHGIADTVDASGDLEDKLGIRSLPGKETFTTSYTIQLT